VQRAEAGGSKWTAVDAFAAPRTIEHGARVELDPRDARPDPALGASVLAAELELAPTLAISGRLVDEDGDPLAQAFGNRVYAVPAGVPHPYARTALGREAMTWSRDGTFRVDGLPDGVYDVYATSEIEGNFFSFSTGFVRVPGVPAGTAGLEVVVPRRGGVKVRLRVDCAEPLEEATVLIAAVQPRDGRPPAPSPAAIVARELASWPLDAPWDFAGGAMADTPVGREQLGLFAVASPDGHALPELGEGWYRFGLQPNRDADGERAYVPIATELVYLRPGEHEVRFELTPAAPLDGRLASKSPVAHLAVQLVDARGRAIPQPSGKGFALKLLSWVPLRADGSFRIAIAPVGPCTLRVGTAAELERGELRHEVEVDVRPLGEALLEPIEIRL
jgi:hypothetical protein